MAFGDSTYPAVVHELLARIPGYIAADRNDPPVEVVFGSPGDPGQIPDRFIAVGPSDGDQVKREPRRLPFVGARTSMSEDYPLAIIIWSFSPNRYDTESATQVFDDAWALFSMLNAGLRATDDDVTLGGLVGACWLGDVQPSEHFLAEGRAMQLYCDLTVTVYRT